MTVGRIAIYAVYTFIYVSLIVFLLIATSALLLYISEKITFQRDRKRLIKETVQFLATLDDDEDDSDD